ncbi:MAG TPA: oligoendopeptidase F, partial [candidate division Zixibacteria bacterium]|nr:oligoendopeptidase F [candidate division Zixibacteria bacterium]
LKDSPQILFECLELRTLLNLLVFQLFQYSRLNRDIDNRVSKYQSMTDRAAMLSSEAGAAFSFVEPELLKMSDSELLIFASQFPKNDLYDFYIRELIRSRKHVRSEEVEEILAQSAMVARGADNIFTMLDDADITYPAIKDEHDVEVSITKQRYMKFLESSDARIRKDAHYAFYSAYKNHLNTLGASLAASVNNDIFYSRARKFNTCLESALNGDNIPLEVYHSLINNTEKYLEPLHKYVSVRKKILNLEKIHMYDMICPLFPEREYDVPYDHAVFSVLESSMPLGNTYANYLKDAFENRWVDVYETPGKGSGAYNWGNYKVHPFVLMNYNNTIDNMFTLAHELGHAMHSHLANQKQPFQKSQYSIFVAEVASTLNEGLLLQHMLNNAKDDLERLSLLNRQIDNTVGTYFNQVMYAKFELAIHEAVEKGGALSPEMMTNLWKELNEKYYGPDLTIDEFSILKWSRIPHFYNAFYVYQYATSYAASQAILVKFLHREKGVIDKYIEMLSSGGNDYPIELLKKCGVDMTAPSPVEANLQMFAEQVNEMEKLSANLKR